jgi:membrane associated rhomboid family serine protease
VRYLCGNCGAEAEAGGCPRCSGPSFDVDTAEGRQNAEHYRAIAEDRATQGPVALIANTILFLPIVAILVIEAVGGRDAAALGWLRLGDLAAWTLLSLVAAVMAYQHWHHRRLARALQRLDEVVVPPRPSRLRAATGFAAFWLFVLCFVGGLFPESQVRLLSLKPESVRQGAEAWTLLTSMFVHHDLGHAVFMGLFLYLYGRVVEPQVGRVRLVAVFVAGGVVGGLTQVVCGGEAPVVGAAASVVAISGCAIGLAPTRSIAVLFPGGLSPSLPAAFAVPLSLALFELVAFLEGIQLPWLAHVGGLCIGVFFGALFRQAEPAPASLAVPGDPVAPSALASPSSNAR